MVFRDKNKASPDVQWLPRAEHLWTTFRVTLLALLHAWHERLSVWATLFGCDWHEFGVNVTVREAGDQHTLCIRTVQYHKTIEEQHVFLLEQIKAISVNQICSTDGRQVVSLHVKAKWMETMTCSAQPLGILPDWFGRQLIGITPELFDEADKKQCKTLQLHYPPSCSPDSGTFGQH